VFDFIKSAKQAIRRFMEEARFWRRLYLDNRLRTRIWAKEIPNEPGSLCPLFSRFVAILFSI
jgi:hypothetical protein